MDTLESYRFTLRNLLRAALCEHSDLWQWHYAVNAKKENPDSIASFLGMDDDDFRTLYRRKKRDYIIRFTIPSIGSTSVWLGVVVPPLVILPYHLGEIEVMSRPTRPVRPFVVCSLS